MLALLLLVLAQTRDVPAQDAPPMAVLRGFDELQARLKDTDPPRLLDVRSRADYDKGHIPGAVWADVKAAEAIAAGLAGFSDRMAWGKWIAPLGIDGNREVVVYGENRQLDAARVWWLLTYLGVQRVSLLDGNFSLWAKQGRPTDRERPEVAKSTVAIGFRRNRLATREDVREMIEGGGAQIVDARTLGEHLGTEKRSKRAGRLPTACRLEWSDLVDRDGRFLDEKALRAKASAVKVAEGSAVITHCQGGGRASVDAFVFERLGHPTRNYYLGWSDWGNAEGTPVESGTPR